MIRPLSPFSSKPAASRCPAQRGGTRRRRARRSALLAMIVYLPLLTAAAPPSGLEGLGRTVSDAELGEMRGKFITPDAVAYFGLTLQSSWQTGDGVTTYATIAFNVDFASGGSPTPHLLIGWNRECEGCGDSAMDVTQFGEAARDDYVAISTASGDMPIGGLNSVQGAVQSVNVSGADNQVRNNMQVAVIPVSALPAGQPGLSEVTGSTSKTFSDGDIVHFILEPGQIALALKDGNDMVRQGVSSELNQAAQHVLLASDMNRVNNFMSITVGINELRQMDRARIDSALSVMKGRGF